MGIGLQCRNYTPIVCMRQLVESTIIKIMTGKSIMNMHKIQKIFEYTRKTYMIDSEYKYKSYREYEYNCITGPGVIDESGIL